MIYRDFGMSISQGASKHTELIVGHFQKRGLEEGLRSHGNRVRRAIESQRLFTEELIQDARQHIQVMEKLAVKDDYRDLYFSDFPLPSSWPKTRSDLLNSPEALPALTAAEKASAKHLTGGSSGAEWQPALIEMRIALDDAVPTSE